MQPPAFCTQVEEAEVGGVVDEERRLGELVAGLQDLVPVLLDVALAEPVGRDPGPRGDEPVGELGLRHLEREERDRALRLPGDVLGDVADEARLAHRRAGSEDDQVAGLKAAGDLVELPEAGWGTGHLRFAARQLVELVELDAEDRLQRAEVACLLGPGDVEEQHLGPLDEILRLALAGLDRLLNRLGGAEQPPQHRVLLDDLGVVAGVAGDRGRRCERVDDVLTAGLLELALAAEQLGDGQRIDRLAALEELVDGGEDRPVAAAIEVLGAQPRLPHDRVDRRLRHHHRAEHRLLGLEAVRLQQRHGAAAGSPFDRSVSARFHVPATKAHAAA